MGTFNYKDNTKKGSLILWLPSWYPNKLDLYNGDFIKRHADAASLYEQIELLFIVNDKAGIVTKNVLEENYEHGLLHERVIYYHFPSVPIKIIDTILIYLRFFKIYKREIKRLCAEKGKPNLVHVHVISRTGIIAAWIKKNMGIEYVITEHWSGYLAEARPNYSQLSFLIKNIFKRVFDRSLAVTVVSKSLGKRLKQLFSFSSFAVLPNVVDTNIFKFEPQSKKTKNQFVHISTLTYQKDPEHILEAFLILKNDDIDFMLDIIGPHDKNIRDLILKLGLSENVKLHSEMPQANIVPFIQNANALILYSRYETFGCVVIEANTCGVPVIVSDIEVMHEIVTEGVNGTFVSCESPNNLAKKIADFINIPMAFDEKNISKDASERYSYRSVGLQFHQFYKQIQQS